jgi:thiamine kinase-like enzyme
MEDMPLTDLMDFLSSQAPSVGCRFAGWEIQPTAAGHNNRVYRATSVQHDLAVKFYRVDARDRAGREFRALAVLRDLGLKIAPEPVLLERERYASPVMVQTWLNGPVYEAPPGSQAEWQRLAEHYNTIHSVTPAQVSQAMSPAVLTFQRAQQAAEGVLKEMESLPKGAKRPELMALMRKLEACSFPSWEEPAACLSRCDPSTHNLVRRDGVWASVDWENAGWGDAGFEMGDLMAHPLYSSVQTEQWECFLDAVQASRPADADFKTRAWTYRAILLVRFAGIFSRSWHQRDAGMAETGHIKQYSPEWWVALPDQYHGYCERAREALMGIEVHQPP